MSPVPVSASPIATITEPVPCIAMSSRVRPLAMSGPVLRRRRKGRITLGASSATASATWMTSRIGNQDTVPGC
jgi:hypothetical protein